MGKTIPAKWETVCSKLGCDRTFDTLTQEVALLIKKYSGYGPRINLINSTVISNLIEVHTGVKVSRSNWSNYKKNGNDFLSKIAERLNIKVTNDSCNYEFKKIGDSYQIEFYESPGCFTNRATKVSTSVESQYEYWYENGSSKLIGTKKYWPTNNVKNALRKKGFHDTEWPTSVFRAKNLASILKEKHIIPIINKSNSQQEFNKEVLNLSNAISNKTIDKYKALKGNSDYMRFEFTPTEGFPADIRHVPYFYIKSTGLKSSKIGKADLTSNRLKDNDTGILVQLRQSEDKQIAYKCETEFREWLRETSRFSPSGSTEDHYDLTINDLVILFSDYISHASSLNASVKEVYISL
ncbi:hypothetical protein [Vibrio palustris]|uniref:Uncharacterized protein n=1 Tax=Vibrio palustris TaxID=1918946 RepID=A0A1R4B6J0_9VIBR|nr:hypothetical protein [Vibrio palustris]SJL84532.1 hypothetical protein VPAL9027_02521 [Vibrio palustris]